MGLFVGLLIGLVLGLTGAGGSVFAVPLLILLVGLPLNDAVGLALGAVAVSALYGSLRNGSQRLVLWLPALLLALSGAMFAPLGKWLGTQLADVWLMLGFNVLAAVIALRMLYQARRNPVSARVVRSSPGYQSDPPGSLCRLGTGGQFELRPRCVSGLVAGGLVVGLLSWLFGVGGGFLIVPLLLLLSQLGMAQAVATSLVIIAVVSGSGFVSHLLMSSARVDWALLGLVAAGGVFGMLIGQWVSRHTDGARLQQLFAVSLVGVSLASLFHLGT